MKLYRCHYLRVLVTTELDVHGAESLAACNVVRAGQVVLALCQKQWVPAARQSNRRPSKRHIYNMGVGNKSTVVRNHNIYHSGKPTGFSFCVVVSNTRLEMSYYECA